MKIEKIDLYRSAEYRMNEQFQNCQFFFSQIVVFQIAKVLEICRFSNLENSKNFQIGKSQKLSVCKVLQISDLENYKNLQFEKSKKFAI